MANYRLRRGNGLMRILIILSAVAVLQSCALSKPHHGCGCGMEERMGRR